MLNFHRVLYSLFPGLSVKTLSRVYFSLCLFLAISGISQTQQKLNPREKFPIYGTKSTWRSGSTTTAWSSSSDTSRQAPTPPPPLPMTQPTWRSGSTTTAWSSSLDTSRHAPTPTPTPPRPCPWRSLPGVLVPRWWRGHLPRTRVGTSGRRTWACWWRDRWPAHPASSARHRIHFPTPRFRIYTEEHM